MNLDWVIGIGVILLIIVMARRTSSSKNTPAVRTTQSPPTQPEGYFSYSQKKRNEAILWARDVLARKEDFIIVDTETTGLKEKDVVIHFAAMDIDGNMLVDSYIKPTRKRKASEEAEFIHGITSDDLKTAPSFEKVMQQFLPLAAGRTVLIYHSDFHSRLMQQTYEIDGLLLDGFNNLDFDCIQQQFQYYHNRDYLAMPGRTNTGEGDCRAALKVIQTIAESATYEEKRLDA